MRQSKVYGIVEMNKRPSPHALPSPLTSIISTDLICSTRPGGHGKYSCCRRSHLVFATLPPSPPPGSTPIPPPPASRSTKTFPIPTAPHSPSRTPSDRRRRRHCCCSRNHRSSSVAATLPARPPDEGALVVFVVFVGRDGGTFCCSPWCIWARRFCCWC